MILEVQSFLVEFIKSSPTILDEVQYVGNNGELIEIGGELTQDSTEKLLFVSERQKIKLSIVLKSSFSEHGCVASRCGLGSGQAIFVDGKKLGTLGLRTVNRSGPKCWTAKHVLPAPPKMQGSYAVSDCFDRTVGVVSQDCLTYEYDLARIDCTDGIHVSGFVNSKGRFRKFNFRKRAQLQSGLKVLSIGAASKGTLGRIELKNVWARVPWLADAEFVDDAFIAVSRNGYSAMTVPGDSGAVVCSEVGLQPIGMVLGAGIRGTLCQPYPAEIFDLC